MLLKFVSFKIGLRTAFWGNKIERFSAFGTTILLISIFLYILRATFGAGFFNS